MDSSWLLWIPMKELESGISTGPSGWHFGEERSQLGWLVGWLVGWCWLGFVGW